MVTAEILHLKEDKANGTPPILYSAHVDVSTSQWKLDFGFSWTTGMGHVSNDEKCEHLTKIQTTHKGSKAFEGTSMICTSESECWIQALSLTEVLGFAELEYRLDARKVLQLIDTECPKNSCVTPTSRRKSHTKSSTETEPSKRPSNSALYMEDSSHNTPQHLAEASALLRWIHTLNAPPRTEQQQVAEALVRMDLPGPQYDELSEDEKETEHRPLKKSSMVGTPRITQSTNHPATRKESRDEPKRLGKLIQFTTRIGRRSTQGNGHPSALTSIARTTEEWPQLLFFWKGPKNLSPPSTDQNSQNATQHLQLRYKQSPDHTEETGT
ncbi:hypothetical protein BDD12DRAFT_806083 [Trichophaea hybrida]|nr:hypothetical protein BDD12DRAFT_806083 [Trichophaea hybrida]